MEKMYFGAAYYREYMPYERLDEDIKLLKKAGMNYVRIAESTWSTYEKHDGVFDFSTVLTVLDKMHAAGIAVIVGTPTYAIPAWLAKKHPEVMAETLNGPNRYGARQLMDITHPTYLYYADRIIRHLLEAVHDHPAVIGYQLDNETKHYGTSSLAVQRGFVAYLKQYFKGDLASLNQAFGLDYWSNRIDSWEDFPDVRGTINGSLWCAFAHYQRTLVDKFLAHQVAIVRPYLKPGQFLTHNFDFEWRNFSFGVQPDVHHYTASKALDITGVDIYHLSQDELTGREISFGGAMARCTKDQRYLVLETQAQAFKNWTPFPGQLRLQAMAHLASGARMIGYWHWHSLHNSFETYWKGVLSHDFKENPVYTEACTIGAQMRTLEPHLDGYLPQSRVCVVVSNDALSAIDRFPYQGPSLNVEVQPYHTYNDVVRRYCDALYAENISADIRDIDDPKIFDYEVVVLPLLYTVSDAWLQKLVAYVQGGGHIIASFKTAFTDENLKVRTSEQPGILRQVVGCTYSLFSEPRKMHLTSTELDLSAEESAISDFMEQLVPDADAQVWARYGHKYFAPYAAAVYHRAGAGSSLYIGTHVTTAFIRKALLKFSTCNGLQLKEHNLSYPLVVKRGQNAAGQTITFILNFAQEAQSFAYPYVGGIELLTGRTVTTGEQVTLPDFGVLVVSAPTTN